ncbi:TIGR02300 family protein [Azospirillaceae bacterium]
MAKPEWGIKRICPNCGARYYDLRRSPPVCPVCGAEFDPEALLKSRRARTISSDELKKVPIEDDDLDVVAVDPSDVVGDGGSVGDIDADADDAPDEDEDVLLEDASELGADDMGEVVVGGPVEDEESR